MNSFFDSAHIKLSFYDFTSKRTILHCSQNVTTKVLTIEYFINNWQWSVSLNDEERLTLEYLFKRGEI